MMNMLVSGVALLLACVGFFAYDQITFRQGLVRTLSAQAQIIGSNSVSALIFNDPQSATNTLSALKSSPNIASASIFTSDRRPFAEYVRDGESQIDQCTADSRRGLGGLLIRKQASRVVALDCLSGPSLGTVYIRADLRDLNDRLIRYLPSAPWCC